MKRLALVLALIAPALCLAQDDPPPKAEDSARKAMDAGNGFMRKKQFAKALEQYQIVLKTDPNATGALYNGGLAAYLHGNYDDSVALWTRLKTVDPADWEVQKKLIQAYQAKDDKPGRDAQIKEFYALRATGKHPKLAKAEFYCRDQFTVGDYYVFAYEHFELKGERAIRWYFAIKDAKTGEKAGFHLSLGSYETTNLFHQQMQKKKGQPVTRLYHLDGYYPKSHKTWGFFDGEPSYDTIREEVCAILLKKRKASSSTTYGKDGPVIKTD